jgi:hypothetical protein
MEPNTKNPTSTREPRSILNNALSTSRGDRPNPSPSPARESTSHIPKKDLQNYAQQRVLGNKKITTCNKADMQRYSMLNPKMAKFLSQRQIEKEEHERLSVLDRLHYVFIKKNYKATGPEVLIRNEQGNYFPSAQKHKFMAPKNILQWPPIKIFFPYQKF